MNLFQKYKLRYSFIVLVLFLLVGCKSEPCKTCVQTKVFLTYNDGRGRDLLAQELSGASLFIYNDMGNLVKSVNLSQQDILNPMGVDVELPLDDEYTLVCWGNIGRNSVLESKDDLQKAKLKSARSASNSTMLATTDPLYFGIEKYYFASKYNNSSRIVMVDLVPKHISFEVTIQGFEASVPQLTVEHALSQYNFYGKAVSDKYSTVQPKIDFVSSIQGFQSTFNVLRPQSLENMYVLLSSAEMIEPKRIDVQKIVREHYPNLDLTKDKIKIEILIKYSNLSVEITIPDWSTNDTNVGVV